MSKLKQGSLPSVSQDCFFICKKGIIVLIISMPEATAPGPGEFLISCPFLGSVHTAFTIALNWHTVKSFWKDRDLIKLYPVIQHWLYENIRAFFVPVKETEGIWLHDMVIRNRTLCFSSQWSCHCLGSAHKTYLLPKVGLAHQIIQFLPQ